MYQAMASDTYKCFKAVGIRAWPSSLKLLDFYVMTGTLTVNNQQEHDRVAFFNDI